MFFGRVEHLNFAEFPVKKKMQWRNHDHFRSTFKKDRRVLYQIEHGCLPTFVPHQLFSDVAYKARDREDLIAGIDEFLDEVIVLPPGEWDPKIRIEPPKKVMSADKRLAFHHLRL